MSTTCCLIFLSLLSFAFANPTHAQSPDHPLRVGETVERELAGGEAHSFDLEAADESFAFVLVTQKGIDVVVEIV